MKKKTMLELGRMSAEEYRQAAKIPLTVVLDDVRSELNVGSILRTADAFAVERVILCGITGKPPSHEIHKTALGAEDSVQWSYCDSALAAVEALKQEGYHVAAVEQVHGSVSLEQVDAPPAARMALVLGNEVKGVSQEVIDACHSCLELPQYGTKHSLNVACTAAIVIWHFFNLLSPKQ